MPLSFTIVCDIFETLIKVIKWTYFRSFSILPHESKYIFFCPVHVPDTILLSISWELCSKYIWLCLLIRIDVTFYLGNEVVVQMLGRTPVYWPRSEHLICIELFHLPTSIHMLMFISETVINLAKIALSTVSYISMCFCKPVQYTLSNHEESHPQLHNNMLKFAFL